MTIKAGRVDVVTDTHVFEVKHFKRWLKGLHQVMAYGHCTGKKQGLALFGAADLFEVEIILDKVREISHFIEVWWYDSSTSTWCDVAKQLKRQKKGLIMSLTAEESIEYKRLCRSGIAIEDALIAIEMRRFHSGDRV